MICNHCGKQTTQTKNVTFRVMRDGEWIEASLCEECHNKLTYIVEQFCGHKENKTLNWLQSNIDDLIDMEY